MTGNIRSNLRGLFKEYMINKNKPTESSNIHQGSFQFSESINIHFYEWSDVCRPPRNFDSLNSFLSYLSDCGIYTKLYERDIITNLGETFISCYRGKRELCIRSSYKSLLNAMNEHDRLQTEIDKRTLSDIFKGGTTLPACVNEGGYEGPWYG